MKVYIAGPYSKGLWEDNIRRVVEAAERVYRQGHYPFISHTMTTLWALLHPKKKEEWVRMDLEWLEVCDAIIRLEGESDGADIEVDFAENRDIKVYDGVDDFVKSSRGMNQ